MRPLGDECQRIDNLIYALLFDVLANIDRMNP